MYVTMIVQESYRYHNHTIIENGMIKHNGIYVCTYAKINHTIIDNGMIIY